MPAKTDCDKLSTSPTGTGGSRDSHAVAAASNVLPRLKLNPMVHPQLNTFCKQKLYFKTLYLYYDVKKTIKNK